MTCIAGASPIEVDFYVQTEERRTSTQHHTHAPIATRLTPTPIIEETRPTTRDRINYQLRQGMSPMDAIIELNQYESIRT